MKMEMQQIDNCPLCESTIREPFLEDKEVGWYGKVFKLVICECSHIYTPEVPILEEKMKMLFGPGNKMTMNSLRRPHLFRYHEKLYHQLVEKHHKPKRWFGVGCGTATLLKIARDYGAEVSGNDINQPTADLARYIWGIEVFNTPTIDMPDLKEKVDYVTMLDYIEHTYTPVEDLKWAYRNMEHKGVLFIKTFYMNSPRYEREGKEHFSMYSQEHFQYWTEENLVKALERAGFVIADIRRDGFIIFISAIKFKEA